MVRNIIHKSQVQTCLKPPVTDYWKSCARLIPGNFGRYRSKIEWKELRLGGYRVL